MPVPPVIVLTASGSSNSPTLVSPTLIQTSSIVLAPFSTTDVAKTAQFALSASLTTTASIIEGPSASLDAFGRLRLAHDPGADTQTLILGRGAVPTGSTKDYIYADAPTGSVGYNFANFRDFGQTRFRISDTGLISTRVGLTNAEASQSAFSILNTSLTQFLIQSTVNAAPLTIRVPSTWFAQSSNGNVLSTLTDGKLALGLLKYNATHSLEVSGTIKSDVVSSSFFAGDGTRVTNVVSSSYAFSSSFAMYAALTTLATSSLSASVAVSSSYAQTASLADLATTASFALRGTTSSFAVSSSYAPIPYLGDLTGSLGVFGPTTLTDVTIWNSASIGSIPLTQSNPAVNIGHVYTSFPTAGTSTLHIFAQANLQSNTPRVFNALSVVMSSLTSSLFAPSVMQAGNFAVTHAGWPGSVVVLTGVRGFATNSATGSQLSGGVFQASNFGVTSTTAGVSVATVVSSSALATSVTGLSITQNTNGISNVRAYSGINIASPIVATTAFISSSIGLFIRNHNVSGSFTSSNLWSEGPTSRNVMEGFLSVGTGLFDPNSILFVSGTARVTGSLVADTISGSTVTVDSIVQNQAHASDSSSLKISSAGTSAPVEFYDQTFSTKLAAIDRTSATFYGQNGVTTDVANDGSVMSIRRGVVSGSAGTGLAPFMRVGFSSSGDFRLFSDEFRSKSGLMSSRDFEFHTNVAGVTKSIADVTINNGKVGIGTANPVDALHVVGGAKIDYMDGLVSSASFAGDGSGNPTTKIYGDTQVISGRNTSSIFAFEAVHQDGRYRLMSYGANGSTQVFQSRDGDIGFGGGNISVGGGVQAAFGVNAGAFVVPHSILMGGRLDNGTHKGLIFASADEPAFGGYGYGSASFGIQEAADIFTSVTDANGLSSTRIRAPLRFTAYSHIWRVDNTSGNAGGDSVVMILTNSGSLGIGTRSPATMLHVAGAISSSQTLFSYNNGVAWGDGSNKSIKMLNADTMDFRVSGSQSYFQFGNAAQSTSPIVFFTSGGVVTANKFSINNTGSLEVAGFDFDSTGGSDIIVRGGNSTQLPASPNGKGGKLVLRAGKHTDNTAGNGGTPGAIIFQGYTAQSASLQELARIVSDSGFMGLGTATPSTKLHIVQGDIFLDRSGSFGRKIQGADNESITFNSGTLDFIVQDKVSFTSLTGSSTTLLRLAEHDGIALVVRDVESPRDLWISSGNPNSAMGQTASIQVGPRTSEHISPLVVKTPNPTAGFNAGTIILDGGSASLGGKQGAIVIKSGGVEYARFVTGSLGIGTPAPQAQLHVIGNSVVTGTSVVSGTLTAVGTISASRAASTKVLAGGAAETGNATLIALGDSGSNTIARFGDGNNGTLRLGAPYTGTVAMGGGLAESILFGGRDTDTGPFTEWVRVQGSTGNVGIGTTNPTSKLHVVGHASVTLLTGSAFYTPGNGSWSMPAGTFEFTRVGASPVIFNDMSTAANQSLIVNWLGYGLYAGKGFKAEGGVVSLVSASFSGSIVAGTDADGATTYSTVLIRPGRSTGNGNNADGLSLKLQAGEGTGAGKVGNIEFLTAYATGSGAQALQPMTASMMLSGSGDLYFLPPPNAAIPNGIVLQAPNGSQWKIQVSNTGVLSTIQVK